MKGGAGIGLPSLNGIWTWLAIVVIIWTSERLSKEPTKTTCPVEVSVSVLKGLIQKEEEEEEYFPIPQMRLSDFFPLEEDDDDDDDKESGVARAKRGPRVSARSQQTLLSKSARCAVRACV